MGFPGDVSSKESTCQCRRLKKLDLIPGSWRSPGGGHSNPLQDSCLENPMNRGAWWATVHGVTKNRTWPKQLSAPLGRSKRPDMYLAFLSFNLCFWSMHFFPGLCCQQQGCICLCRSCGFFWCWIIPLLRRLNCRNIFKKFLWIHDVCIILQIGKAVSHKSS